MQIFHRMLECAPSVQHQLQLVKGMSLGWQTEVV